MNGNKLLLVLAAVLILLILCCCVLLIVGASAGVLFLGGDETSSQPTPGVAVSEEFPPIVESASREAYDTLQALQNTIVPNNDLRELAVRLGGIETDVPETMNVPAANLNIGVKQSFWVTNMDTDENFEVDAVLEYKTSHSYFWVEDGIQFDEDELSDLADTFEEKIYPTNRAFFGSEWTPGIDNDEHLYVMFVRGIGFSIAGYFSSVDSIHPLAHEYSNAHEMFVMNADNLELNDAFTYGVLAHEFQHMIHWYQDRNESTWLNEGFSELAALLNGYYEGGFDSLYIWEPDLQVNDWPNDPNATTPHYGAAFLYVAYFLDRFGESATQALVANPANGMDSVDKVLTDLGAIDPLSGAKVGADDVFADWAVTNFLLDEKVSDGRFAYYRYDGASKASETEWFSDCSSGGGTNEWQTRDVSQYGVDYIAINCKGDYTLSFQGVTEVGVLPQDAYSGSFAYWSNKGDESDMRLTQQFDFRDHSGPLTLSFWTWYDIEEGYDYVYLEASEDGEEWQILTTPSGTPEDPSGNSYGWGYNDQTGDWIQEEVDISRFVGKQVYLRFEYVTDAAVNGEGFMLDDVSIPEIEYMTDFEKDAGGWESEGWVRIQNRLPQTYRVSLIEIGDIIRVESVELDELQSFQMPFTLDNETDEAILVVSGTARFTRQPALYRYRLE
jgi:immune inhibitor A